MTRVYYGVDISIVKDSYKVTICAMSSDRQILGFRTINNISAESITRLRRYFNYLKNIKKLKILIDG